MSANPSRLAYELADRIGDMYASEIFKQQTMQMEPTEFRDFFALQIQYVLSGSSLRLRWAPRTPAGRQHAADAGDGEPVHITHDAAMRLLEAAPGEVRAVYKTARHDGLQPKPALEAALAALQRIQDEKSECQVAG